MESYRPNPLVALTERGAGGGVRARTVVKESVTGQFSCDCCDQLFRIASHLSRPVDEAFVPPLHLLNATVRLYDVRISQ
jgi:hypothetical protein